jgi:hypothetical protein
MYVCTYVSFNLLFNDALSRSYDDAQPRTRRPDVCKKEVGTCQKERLLKNDVLWDVAPCGSCKNRRFGGT